MKSIRSWLWTRRKWWLYPLVTLVVTFLLLLLLVGDSGRAPFLYNLY
jgi:hypothetical protein